MLFSSLFSNRILERAFYDNDQAHRHFSFFLAFLLFILTNKYWCNILLHYTYYSALLMIQSPYGHQILFDNLI